MANSTSQYETLVLNIIPLHPKILQLEFHGAKGVVMVGNLYKQYMASVNYFQMFLCLPSESFFKQTWRWRWLEALNYKTT